MRRADDLVPRRATVFLTRRVPCRFGLLVRSAGLSLLEPEEGLTRERMKLDDWCD